ncbi:MAG TPA: FG-GAP-like repeat-containing protein [Clostridia bacterium]|nr:FG-GAP-like repeat-containing protein [Clostridia bacterium]
MKKPLPYILIGLALLAVAFLLFSRRDEDQFGRSMTLGAGYLQKGEATNAIAAFEQSVKMMPESIDARLNLANAYLLANQNENVITQCQQVLRLDHNSAAAHYLMGCAYLRLNQAEKAVQAFQESQKIDPAVSALNFQLGIALERAGHTEDAIREFETLTQFEPDHPSAHYQLSRLYQRTGREAEAAQELAAHQQVLAKTPNPPSGPLAFERCKYTEPRLAFVPEQADPRGVAVRFVDATPAVFGQNSSRYHGPLAVLDYNHDGRNSLFVVESNGFRLLNNLNGKFEPLGEPLPAPAGETYSRCLAGDLNADRFEDVVMLGEQASHVFRFATNGQFREVTAASGLKNLKAKDGLLADLDFSGKLDLLTVLPGGQGLRTYRNLGNFYFLDNTTNSGLPAVMSGIQQVTVEDWNNEDVPGVIVTRTGQPPVFFSKQRAGAFIQTNFPTPLPSGGVIVPGDLNNDLLLDFVLAGEGGLHVAFTNPKESLDLPAKGLQVKDLLLLDYDNDGWLDIVAYGSGIRVWRNAGKAGFKDFTAALGLEKVGPVQSLAAADFDNDGDTDIIVSSASALQYLRNDGANVNRQLKLQLVGTRSNPSALGVRVELVAGRWRTIRTLNRLPFEIGVGKHDTVDLIKTRWFDLATTVVDVPVQSQPTTLTELSLPTGSCPYLYVWNGQKFDFVTDILGSAPMGLPVSETRYVEADPEEFLALGNESQFQLKDGKYELRITEELREVLYLDHAKLVVVDHPEGTVVHPTSKMLPGRPFPPHELWTLRPVASVQKATRSDGLDITAALVANDCQMVSPVRLREPQLRGLVEPYSVTMDFGQLPVSRPLVLVLHGWIRFGGGMANFAASLDPNLPFPFPTLEAELADGSWQAVQAGVGTPAGKTKTILVDLANKLPEGTRRLRLSAAFELYWDSAFICEKVADESNQVTALLPEVTDLHWRGYSQFKPLPSYLPLTPDYEQVQFAPPWRRTLMGWCTRYGEVDELIREKDNALVLLNGGDELSLSFASHRLPPKPAGFVRDFFLYVVGWDKDADFHVGQGWRVDPLPFLGMDDQAYGQQPRPAGLDDSWIAKYNTRWVGSLLPNRNVKP